MNDIHYLNADFDLSLRERPLSLRQPSLQRAVGAMTVQGLLLGGAGDALLVRAGVPDSFVDYLGRQGIEAPKLLRHPPGDPGMRLCPFGWNGEAIAINDGQRFPVPHPGLEVVRLVNSRVFSATLEKEHLAGEDGGTAFSSTDALAAWLASREDSADGWVVKADHGNAALGNRRIRGRKLSRGDVLFVDGLLSEDGQAVVEPWRQRLSDLSAVFVLRPSGELEGLRFHETVCTGDGALIGAIFDQAGREWPEALHQTAEVVAAELSRRDYFGPVCFDAFTYRRGREQGLRTLVDLNCRRPVSDTVFRFWRDRLAGRTLLWRFFNTRRLRPDVEEVLTGGEEAYHPAGRRGTLLTSPRTIEIDCRPMAAPKLSVAFIGTGREEVLAMESAFRGRFEK
jgi:hypothetical protein